MNAARNNLRQSGFSMIEVLVALVILMVGLLGLAGVMVQSQRSEVESYQRVQAMILLQDIAERINANRMAAGAPLVSVGVGGNCYNFTLAAAGTPYLGTGTTFTPTCTANSIVTSYNLSSSTPYYVPGATGTALPTYTTAVTTNPAATAITDLLAWNYALQGVAEKSGGANAGALIGARGCISYDPGSELTANDGTTVIYGSGIYTVSIAWQGLGDTYPPPANLTCGTGLYLNSQGITDEALRRVVSLTFRIGSINNTN